MKRDRKWAEEAARELVGKMTLEEKSAASLSGTGDSEIAYSGI